MYNLIGLLLIRIQVQLLVEIIRQMDLIKLGGCGDKRIYGCIGVASAFDCRQ
jgi:hypothetical protein